MLLTLLQQAADPGGDAIRAAFSADRAQITASMAGFWPELALAILACGVLLLDLFLPRAKSRLVTGTVSAVGLVIVAWLVCRTDFHGTTTPAGLFLGMVTQGKFAAFLKLIFIGGTLVTAGFTGVHKDFAGWRMGEYWALMLTSVLGMFLMVSASNVLMAYLGIEMVSLASFVLVCYTRSDARSSEAALKYVVYGAMASGLMLYGLSFFYGVTGSLQFAGLPAAMTALGSPAAVAVAALLTLMGVGYKIAAVPSHFWCPDVYEGAPTPVTAWLSVTSKAAGIGLLLRLVHAADSGGSTVLSWGALVALLSAATMTVGNLSAMRQTNIKRLLAYSSIAHAGYLMMAAVVLGPDPRLNAMAWQAVAFYLAVYACMNLAAFAIVLFFRNSTGSEAIADYRGFGLRHPWLGATFALLLFSLIGVPPTAGFFGKLWLFQAVLEAPNYSYVWLAVVAGANTAVSAYYYMGLIKIMYLDEATAETPTARFSPQAMATVMALAAPILILGLWSSPLVALVQGLTR